MIRAIMFSLCLCFCTGCVSTTAPISATEDRKDVENALETIAEAISGNDMSEEEMMEEAGFGACEYHNMTGGIVALHKGIKV